MKVFKDVFTNDEVLSENFKYELAFDDTILKVKSSLINKEDAGNVDIGCGNAFGGEEEGGEEGAGAGGEKVLDVVHVSNLTSTTFSKAEFMAFIKNFLKNLKTYLEENGKQDRVQTFQKGAQEFIKQVVAKFDEYEFYLGASESMEGSVILAFWEDESASGPMFYLFKDALKEEKY